MTGTQSETSYEIIWLVRRLFRAMGDTADKYLKSADLSAADRAVLEFLYPHQALSVPEIANRYRVSRQHIQVTVNSLLEKGLLRSEVNPRHKRSPLLRLGEHGRTAFEEIRRHEKTRIDELFAGLPGTDLETTDRLLRALLQRLS